MFLLIILSDMLTGYLPIARPRRNGRWTDAFRRNKTAIHPFIFWMETRRRIMLRVNHILARIVGKIYLLPWMNVHVTAKVHDYLCNDNSDKQLQRLQPRFRLLHRLGGTTFCEVCLEEWDPRVWRTFMHYLLTILCMQGFRQVCPDSECAYWPPYDVT